MSISRGLTNIIMYIRCGIIQILSPSLIGNSGNYVSRGFVSCKKKNVSYIVDGNFPTALLVCELVPNALDGRKWMHIPSTAADCCEDTAAVEAFDATFSFKEKAWMPS